VVVWHLALLEAALVPHSCPNVPYDVAIDCRLLVQDSGMSGEELEAVDYILSNVHCLC